MVDITKENVLEDRDNGKSVILEVQDDEVERERLLLSKNERGYRMNEHHRNGTTSESVPGDVGIGTLSEHHGQAPGPAGSHALGVDSPRKQIEQVSSEGIIKPTNSTGYFNQKSERRREEAKHWDEIGDEDLFGNADGKCGLKRIFWRGSLDSQGSPRASSVEVKDIFRHCIMALGAYGDDMNGLAKVIQEHNCQFDPKQVVDLQHPKVPGACPPYFIYVDHEHKEVSMYIRGLNLLHRQDYVALLNNRRGEKAFDGGYIHHGMAGPAEWAIKHVGPILKDELLSNKGYRLTIVGHSLGAGVAALLTIFLVHNTEVVGGINENTIRAVIFAPPRVMSLDLAIKYAPYVNSIIYQDDFLPRVSTQAVKRLFLNTFALTKAIVFIFWVRQAVDSKASKDTRRLFPPGKIYHFVYKQPGRPGHRPIRARVVPSAKNRFERLVLSASGTTSNHFILTLANHLKKYDWPEELKDPWLTSVLETAKT